MHLLLFIFLVACGTHESKSVTIPISLKEKGDFYVQKLDEKVKQSGFVHSVCDDLLFRCIARFSGSVLDYAAYGDGSGRWYRDRQHDCFDRGASESDFSQDMTKGLELCFIANKDLENTEKTISYLESNWFIMGRGDKTRTFMSPSQMRQLYAVRDFIKSGVALPLTDSADGIVVKTGFEAHVQVLSIFIDSIIYGHVSDTDLWLLKQQKERQPRNALFQAMYHRFSDGDQSAAANILADVSLFPNDRLPSSRDRSEDYLWQRDDTGRDWGAGENDEEHFGVDFLFAYEVMK